MSACFTFYGAGRPFRLYQNKGLSDSPNRGVLISALHLLISEWPIVFEHIDYQGSSVREPADKQDKETQQVDSYVQTKTAVPENYPENLHLNSSGLSGSI